MHISVTLLSGEKLEFDVSENSCVIGRSPKCKVVIPHDGVSRQHCMLEVEKGEVFVTDLASTNGVYIDGQKIGPNVRTEFKTYLPLSFGPVQSLLVYLESDYTSPRKNPFLQNPTGQATAENLATTTRAMNSKLKVGKIAPAQQPAAVAPKKKSSVNFQMVFATLMAVLIVAAAWYIQMSGENSGETESPAATEKNPSGPVEYY